MTRNFSGGGTSRPAGGGDIATGALVANTVTVVTHNYNLRDYQLEVRDAANNVAVKTLRKNAANPLNAIDVEVSINIPAGLTISVIGY